MGHLLRLYIPNEMIDVRLSFFALSTLVDFGYGAGANALRWLYINEKKKKQQQHNRIVIVSKCGFNGLSLGSEIRTGFGGEPKPL